MARFVRTKVKHGGLGGAQPLGSERYDDDDGAEPDQECCCLHSFHLVRRHWQISLFHRFPRLVEEGENSNSLRHPAPPRRLAAIRGGANSFPALERR